MKEYLFNIYLRIRFYILRVFFKERLKNISDVKKKDYVLTFNEDFNNDTWNNNKNWKVGEHWGLVHEGKRNMYYGAPTIRDNKGIFTVKYKPATFDIDGQDVEVPYEVSLLSSYHYFKQAYGRFECRCILPKEPYTWPAFWLWGEPWPPEIDILECYGGKTGKSITTQVISLHDTNKKTRGSWKRKVENYKDFGEFHEFVLEWSPDKLEFFTDGIKILKVTNKKIVNYYNEKQWIVVNHGIQKELINDKGFYSEFEVDYIRAYELPCVKNVGRTL